MELTIIIIGFVIYLSGVYMSFVEYAKRVGIWFLYPVIFPIVIIVSMASWISYVYMKMHKDESFL